MQADTASKPDAQTAKKKRQLTIIGLLLFGLLIAFVTQPGQDKSPAPSPATVAKPVKLKPDASTFVDPANKPPPDEMVAIRPLKGLTLEQVMQAKLFYEPPKSQPELKAATQTDAAVKINAIYSAGRLTQDSEPLEPRVLIGKSIIRAGGRLRDGRQIVKVTSDGVEIAQ